MGTNTNIAEIRARFTKLTKMTPLTPDLVLAHFNKLIKDAENARASEIKAAEDMERKATASRAKAEAYSGMASMAYNVINQFVQGAEQTEAENEALAAEEAERLKLEKKAKRKRKPRK